MNPPPISMLKASWKTKNSTSRRRGSGRANSSVISPIRERRPAGSVRGGSRCGSSTAVTVALSPERIAAAKNGAAAFHSMRNPAMGGPNMNPAPKATPMSP